MSTTTVTGRSAQTVDDHDGHPNDTGLDVVTGAFSYSGRAIAGELQRHGRQVRTITGHPDRAGDDESIEARPLDFDDLPGLVASLEGATTLYNTYWVRFARGAIDHDRPSRTRGRCSTPPGGPGSGASCT